MNASTLRTYGRPKQIRRDRLITDNLDYVARILSTMTFKIENADERENLNSAGVLGLVEAANSFDPTQGTTFKTYAYPRIRGAIVDELRKLSPVSQALMKQIGIVKKAYETLQPPVSPELLADSTGLTVEQIVECLEAMRFIKPDDWNDLSDIVHGSWRSEPSSPEYHTEREEMRMILADGIEQLPEKERIVLTLYFTDELNLAEIGKVLDLSESRVSRILASAKFRLQESVRCKLH
ncbi:MAG: sigma-70 family RNA polymerase sigma factor [Aureliella sp.]